MTETKTPDPGEYWISDDGSIIRIVGVKLNGGVIYENQAGFSFQFNSMTNWRYEARCDSFNWVEPPAVDLGESPDDWVTQDRCAVRCGSDEVRWSKWEPDEWVVPSGFWTEQEIHGYVDPDDGSTLSIRCLRKYLPVEVLATPETITADTDDMAGIIAEHTQQVRELTQRIDDLVQQVNERDAVIEKIRTALRQEYSV